MQFIPCFYNTVSVIAVHNKNETLSVLEIMPPQGTNLYDKKKTSELSHCWVKGLASEVLIWILKKYDSPVHKLHNFQIATKH